MMTILLRINLDITGNHPDRSPRFRSAVRSIQSVSKDSNKVVLLAHRGRPRRREAKLSLKPFTKYFYRHLERKIKFIPHLNFKKIRKDIDKAPNGSVLLLENTRFFPGETSNSPKLAKDFASLGDKYINDDLPTVHHKNASNYEIAKLMPSSMGSELKKELKDLDKLAKNPKSPSVAIIGGAKMDDKLGVIKRLLPKFDLILLGGGVANTVLKARGVNIGKSLYDKDVQLGSLTSNQRVVTPVDWEVKGDRILDIGKETINEYEELIAKANTILWNGPMGLFEEKPFDRGTKEIAKAVLANKRADIIIGGGDTLKVTKLNEDELKSSKILLSTGGGAMLNYLAGKKLPAIGVLS